MTNKVPDSVEVPNAGVADGSSRALVLDTLFRNPGVSRAAIARQTGLSRQTVGEVVGELEREDLVRPTGQTRGAIGRPATENVINGDAAVGLGVDLGGTNLRVALVDLTGEIRAQFRASTPLDGLDSLAEAIRDAGTALTAEAGLPDGSWGSLAIGIPGVVHPTTGVVRLAVNLPYLNGTQLDAFLEDRLGVAVHVDNDVNFAAIGEWLQLGEGVKDFAFLSVGTGIGMALVLDGRVRRGATGSTGEVGNLPVTGQAGLTLEQAIGARALEARLGSGGRSRTVADALRVKDEDLDPDARALIDYIADHLTEAILGITAIADPEFIVMGGGIGLNEHVQAALDERLASSNADLPPIRPSHWGDSAGLIGSAIETVRLLRSQVLSPSMERTHKNMGIER